MVVRTHIAYFFLFFLLFTYTSCKKSKDLSYTIEGEILDPNYNVKLSGVEVMVYAQEVNNNTFNSNYNLVTSTISESDGSYRLTFDRTNVVDYKFLFSEKNHFLHEIIIQQDDLSVKDINTINAELVPEAFIELRVKNEHPFNENDVIEIFYDKSTTYTCSDCCGSINHKLIGADVDTVLNCPTWANKTVDFQYVVVKNGGFTVTNKSITTTLSDTSILEISY